MKRMMWIAACLGAVLCAALAAPSVSLAQGPPASPVRYTEAREHAIRSSIRLTGTVGARQNSQVASEVAGLVLSVPGQEGTRVAEGEVLATLRTRSLQLRLEAAQGQLKEAAARSQRATLVLKRAKDLHTKGVLSDSELDDAHADFTAWEGQTEALKAQISQIRYDMDRCTIRAPFTGVVVEEHIEPGEWVGIGAPVVRMLSLDDLEIRVDIPERHFAQLVRDAEAAVTLESIPGLEIHGRLASIIPRADPQARTFPVKVALRNPDGRIAVGMLAQVALQVGDPVASVIVPKDAIVPQGPNRMVYVMNEDGSTMPVMVQLGSGAGEWVAVLGDVQPGMKIITRGNERIFPGMTVAGEPLEYPLP